VKTLGALYHHSLTANLIGYCHLTGDWNLQDWKMTDEVAGVEFAGLENGGLENDGVEQEQTYILHTIK